MLTSKQRDLLIFIHERLEKDGVSPSFDEMKDALGLKSKSGVHRLITALEERGFLRRLAHRARALEVQRLPDDYAAKNIEPVSNRRVAAIQRDPLDAMRTNADVLQAGLQGALGGMTVNSGDDLGAPIAICRPQRASSLGAERYQAGEHAGQNCCWFAHRGNPRR